MAHELAQKIFETIRSEPYRVSTEPGVLAANCYFKGIRLITELSQLGYPVKACVGEMDWSKSPLPQEIIELRSKKHQLGQHFWVSIFIDDEWRMIDPSIDPKTAELGFRMVDFTGDTRTCFEVTKTFSQKEQMDNYQVFQDKFFTDEYFEHNRLFFRAVNEWLDINRMI